MQVGATLAWLRGDRNKSVKRKRQSAREKRYKKRGGPQVFGVCSNYRKGHGREQNQRLLKKKSENWEGSRGRGQKHR